MMMVYQVGLILDKTRALWTGSRVDVRRMWRMCLEQARHVPSLAELPIW